MKIERNERGHKGTFGTLLIVGGYDGEVTMLGGPVLTAKAAYRTGVGKVFLSLPSTLMNEGLRLLPEAIGVPRTDDDRFTELLKNARLADAIAVGPGWGTGDHQKSILSALLRLHIPTVIDADAINVMAQHPELADRVHNKCILTPHPGEFIRLINALEIKTDNELSERTKAVVVKKSSETIVTLGEQQWNHDKPNAKLAVAGSGDVLTGIIGALLAQADQPIDIFEVAKTGVELHAAAGERVRPGALATEIADAVDIS